MASELGTTTLSLIGSAIGAYFGGPFGAQIGFLIGTLAAGIIFGPDQPPDQFGPRLKNIRAAKSTYGEGIPIAYGTVAVGGHLIDSGGVEEIAREEEIGRGPRRYMFFGPRKPVTRTIYEYFLSGAYLFCEGPGDIRQVVFDGKKILDFSVTGSTSGLFRYGKGIYTLYRGDETQLPDPTLEGLHGVGQVPGYRGWIYLVLTRFPLADFGNGHPGEVWAEVVIDGPDNNTTEVISATPQTSDNSFLDFFGPYGVNTQSSGDLMVKWHRFTGDEEFLKDLDDDQTFIDGFDDVHTSGGSTANFLSHPWTDPTNGDIYAGTFAAGSKGFVGIWDSEGVYIPNTGIGLLVRRGFNAVMGGSRYVFVSQGLTPNNNLTLFRWVEPPLAAASQNPILISTLQTRTLPGSGQWVSWAWDNREVVFGGRTWTLGNSEPSSEATIVITDREGVMGPRVNLVVSKGITGVGAAHGLAYDVGEDALILVLTNDVYKLDPETLDIIDEVGPNTSNPVPDGGTIGHFDGASDTNLWRNQATLEDGTFMMLDTGDTMVRMRSSNFSIVRRWNDNTDFGVDGFDLGPMWDPVVNALWTDGGAVFRKWYFDRLGTKTTTDKAIVEDLAVRSGLALTDIDATALGPIVRRGYILEDPMPARKAMEPLSQASFWDGVEVDHQILFKLRDGSSVVTIPELDLAAVVEGRSSNEPRIGEIRRQAQEAPAVVRVAYMNQSNDYETTSQHDQRILRNAATGFKGTTSTLHSLDLRFPIVLTDQEAKEIAAKARRSGQFENQTLQFRLPPKYMRLVPTDIITITKTEGSLTASFKIRLTEITYGDGRISDCQGVLAEPTIFTPNVTAQQVVGSPIPAIGFPVSTEMHLLNLPSVLGSIDDGGSAWYAASPEYNVGNPDWIGASLLCSDTEDTGYGRVAAVTKIFSWGLLAEDTTTHLRFPVFDDFSVMDVRLVSGDAPVTKTDLQVYNGANFAFIDGELFKFATVTFLGNSKYRLTRLLRGRNGTELSIAAHKKGTKIVFLKDDFSLMTKFGDLTTRNIKRFYAPEAFAYNSPPSKTVEFTNTSEARIPWTVANLAGSRNLTDDLAISWNFRSRYNASFLLVGNVSLTEDTEEYEVDIVEVDPFFSSVVLLLPFDGADGSTTTLDLSNSAHTMTFGSTAAIDTDQSKFGGSSCEFSPVASNPSNAFVSASDSADWALGSGQFTIDLWARLDIITGDLKVMISQYTNTGNQRSWLWAFDPATNEMLFQYSTDGSATTSIRHPFTPTIDTFHHFAVQRDEQNDIKQFVDGKQIGSTSASGDSFFNSTSNLWVGKIRSVGFNDAPMEGHLEDVRVTKGAARYSGDFNVPVRAAPSNANRSVIRTFTGLVTPAVTYTSAQQITDFGGNQDMVDADVYQISAHVGRGRRASETL